MAGVWGSVRVGSTCHLHGNMFAGINLQQVKGAGLRPGGRRHQGEDVVWIAGQRDGVEGEGDEVRAASRSCGPASRRGCVWYRPWLWRRRRRLPVSPVSCVAPVRPPRHHPRTGWGRGADSCAIQCRGRACRERHVHGHGRRNGHGWGGLSDHFWHGGMPAPRGRGSCTPIRRCRSRWRWRQDASGHVIACILF